MGSPEHASCHRDTSHGTLTDSKAADSITMHPTTSPDDFMSTHSLRVALAVCGAFSSELPESLSPRIAPHGNTPGPATPDCTTPGFAVSEHSIFGGSTPTCASPVYTPTYHVSSPWGPDTTPGTPNSTPFLTSSCGVMCPTTPEGLAIPWSAPTSPCPVTPPASSLESSAAVGTTPENFVADWVNLLPPASPTAMSAYVLADGSMGVAECLGVNHYDSMFNNHFSLPTSPSFAAPQHALQTAVLHNCQTGFGNLAIQGLQDVPRIVTACATPHTTTPNSSPLPSPIGTPVLQSPQQCDAPTASPTSLSDIWTEQELKKIIGDLPFDMGHRSELQSAGYEPAIRCLGNYLFNESIREWLARGVRNPKRYLTTNLKQKRKLLQSNPAVCDMVCDLYRVCPKAGIFMDGDGMEGVCRVNKWGGNLAVSACGGWIAGSLRSESEWDVGRPAKEVVKGKVEEFESMLKAGRLTTHGLTELANMFMTLSRAKP